MSARTQLEADVAKTGDTVTGRFTLKNLPTLDVAEAAKPLYASVGVLDLAIEQAKEVPGEVSARLADIPAQVRTIPASVKSLRGDVETRVEKVTERATDLYTQLSLRGERLVTSIRRQPATEAAVAEGKEAVRKAEAAAVAAQKSAKAGEKAVKAAAGKIG
jgi:hypothetical protein